VGTYIKFYVPPGKGPIIAPIGISDPIHVSWSSVTGSVEFGDLKFGNVGEVQPNTVPATNRNKVTEKNRYIRGTLNNSKYNIKYSRNGKKSSPLISN